jgi:hypothetical protein
LVQRFQRRKKSSCPEPVAQLNPNLDGPLAKWCPAIALSRQDGRYSAVVLLLKAALIQVSDYRLLGASGFIFYPESSLVYTPNDNSLYS